MIEKIRDLSLPQIQQSSIKKNNNINFSDLVKGALDKVNEKQINAEDETIKLVTGEANDLHQVLLATEEAKLSFELAYQMRNKVVEAYQEISRMQI